MSNERVRIVDIAEELGLSTATVSNVIHGKTKKISDETVKRVEELLEKKQYIPSMAGILLAQNNSKIIGVVINNHEKYEDRVLEDAFISSSLNYLSIEIEKAGFFCMIKVTKEWSEISKFASMWNMEGLVVIGFCEQDYRKLRERMHIPFVVYDGYFAKEDNICNLMIDDFDGGYQMGQYFYKTGFKKVLCIADNDICMDHDRFEGFKTGMKENGASLSIVPMRKEERERFYHDNLSNLLSFEAIFAVSDYYAIELIHFLQEQHIDVPKQISVAGFDDSPMCDKICPTLTTIRQDGAKRAKLAIAMIAKMKAGEQGSIHKLPVYLVKRESTKR